MHKRRDLLAEALALAPEERRALAHELLASVDDDIDAVEAWLDVAEVRVVDADPGEPPRPSLRTRSFSPESRMLLASARQRRGLRSAR
jgi:hypothetical protein